MTPTSPFNAVGMVNRVNILLRVGPKSFLARIDYRFGGPDHYVSRQRSFHKPMDIVVAANVMRTKNSTKTSVSPDKVFMAPSAA